MQLHVLPHSNIRHAAPVLLCDISDRAQLRAAQNSVRNPDAHHEKRRRFPFTVRAADHPLPVALRVNAPRTKIGPQPLWRNRGVALPREFANLVNALPRVLGSLEPLDALCLGFLLLAHKKWPLKTKNPPTSIAGGWGSGTKVELRLKSQISYRQSGAPYNMRNKRTDNTASGNNSTYK